MTEASRRAGAQMQRDRITRLPNWSKGRTVGCATLRTPAPRYHCESVGCPKRAQYETPAGKRCFEHARGPKSDAANA